MLVVDAQVHIWGQGLPTNRAHRQITRFSCDDLLKEMDEGGVQAAVIHPPGWDPNANQVALDAAKQHPNRLAILGNFPLDNPESRKLVARWKRQPGMLGLRFSFQQPHQQTWMTDGTMDWLWPAVEKAGIPVALAAANFLPAVGVVAERHPGVRLIVDHMGRPSGAKDAAAWATLPQLLALAKHPNVAVKATGAPSYTSARYPYRDIHGYLQRIYDAFGPERMFWGTDITRMPCSWRQCVSLFTQELTWLTEGEKELIMGRALCQWLGWDLAE
ncbi:MAG: amidohydrolase [Dehalococcoidia bacterium]|nr:amidohydrolase [Dehalococcoidia bacterium]MSQ16496.1 amidohydrolase [Dehalococcoidia bacterium]